MSKFLRLVEENRPGKDKYTVELRDVNGEIVDAFDIFGVGSPFEIFDSFKQEYAPDIPVEDQEVTIDKGNTEFNVDDAVEGLGSKAATGLKGFGAKILGTAAQNAKAAVEEREKLGKDATGLYKAKNRQFKKAIQDEKKGGY